MVMKYIANKVKVYAKFFDVLLSTCQVFLIPAGMSGSAPHASLLSLHIAAAVLKLDGT